jgi:cytochrome oxidase Cu insertion factor (SCO1/SenC/PrrC family)
MSRTGVIAVAVALLVVIGWFVLRSRNGDDNQQPAGPDANAAVETSKNSSHSRPVLGTVPEFTLTDQSGAAAGTRQLAGNVWIVNFMFTRCTATCPAQTREMAGLQQNLAKHSLGKSVRFVSISVDPEHDTPEVLSDYAKEYGADTKTWSFLTGPRAEILKLSQKGFFLPVTESSAGANAPITHSSKFVLVDPYRRIRGFYEAIATKERGELLRDLDQILAERKGHPPTVLNPSWMEARQKAQLATVDQFKVFHDFRFTDRREESGITFHNKIADDAGRNYKPAHYDHGNGVVIADVDTDGLLDIYFVTQAGPNELWRNLGGGRFENITESAGVAVADRIGVTASFADIDNDADADLFVTTVRGGNLLFLNDGTGRFADVSEESGLDHNGHSSGAVFFDYDRDGLLDLFLTNVGKYTTDEINSVTMEPIRGEAPADYRYYVAFMDAFAGHLKPDERNEKSILYRNTGNHRFVDVTNDMGLDDESWTGDASPIDFNSDGWPDLYVLNMQGNDEYYENQQGGKFVRRSRKFFPKTPWGSMGVKVFDYDNDGDFDVFITDMHSDMSVKVGPDREKQKAKVEFTESFLQTKGASIFGNAFYQNQGDGTFREVSDQIGAENYWPWGLSVGDLNADGYDDAFIASSMNLPFRYGVNTLLLNNKGERFLDSEFILGVEPRRDGVTAIPYFECDCDGADKDHPDCKDRKGRVAVWSSIGSRSSVIFDLDDDGDLDIVTNDFNSPPMVLMSDLSDHDQKTLNFIKIGLVGSRSNRDGLGAVVKVTTPSATYVKVNDGQSGYLSQSRFPLYFGLGEESKVSKIEITWPSGTTQTIDPPIVINQTLEISEK